MPAIDHVVVLAFENRSFDHMLGFLATDDPAYEGVIPDDERFSNPIDPHDSSKGHQCVTDDAEPYLKFDPPHSHASVVEQMGIGDVGAPKMNGFVISYNRKIHGNESGRPAFHWVHIGVTGAATVVLVAAILALPWALPLIIGAVVILSLIEVAVSLAYVRRRTLPVDSWHSAFLVPLAVVVLVGSVSALTNTAFAYLMRFGILVVVLLISGALAYEWKRKKANSPPATADDAKRIMSCMSPMDDVPALATLATSFALCTHWHCSVPGATWPNRNFMHAGTSDGTVDIEVGFYENPTIFERLEGRQSWAIYRDRASLAQVMAFEWLLDDDRLGNWRLLEDFAHDVSNDDLPAYSFIEPCHDGPTSNSQHPGNNDYHRPPIKGLRDFERGENLLIQVYEALRANEDLFARTVLVVTYDEHGGFYDHVVPPTDAIAPEPLTAPPTSLLPKLIGWFVEQPDSKFEFKILGPRVPTVIVSPRVPPAPDPTEYDHSAIPRTIRKLYAPNTPPLSAREDASCTFDHLFALDKPRTDLPDLSKYTRREAVFGPLADQPPPAPRDDEFGRQVRKLGREVFAKLSRDRAAFGPLADTEEPSTQDVVDLFTALSDEARQQRNP